MNFRRFTETFWHGGSENIQSDIVNGSVFISADKNFARLFAGARDKGYLSEISFNGKIFDFKPNSDENWKLIEGYVGKNYKNGIFTNSDYKDILYSVREGGLYPKLAVKYADVFRRLGFDAVLVYEAPFETGERHSLLVVNPEKIRVISINFLR